MRTRPGRAEPDVYFRIVHSAQVGHPDAPVAAYREKTVEIALEGPKGASENGSIGALRHQMLSNKVLSAIPSSRGNPKPLKEPKIPRVVEFLRKAIEWQRQLDAGEVNTQADIARREGITRARVTQIMAMLRFPPETRERILSLPETSNRPPITERSVRQILTTNGKYEPLNATLDIRPGFRVSSVDTR